MMKTFFTIALMVLFTFPAFCQNAEEEIKTAHKDYFKALADKDHEKTVGFLYPKLFDHFPKEMMMKVMQEMNDDTDFTTSMTNSKVIRVSNSKKIDGITYNMVDYTFDMVMTFNPEEEEDSGEEESDDDGDDDEEDDEGDEDEEEDEFDFDQLEFMYGLFTSNYGEENVSLDKENKIITIFVSNQMFAINNPEYEGWKFLENTQNMNPLLTKILPEEIMDAW